MKKPVVISVIAVVIVLALGGLLLQEFGSISDSSKETATSNTMPMNSSSSNSSSSESTKPVATDKVDIKDFAFSPASISVKVGTKVTWTNNDSTAHTVTSDSDSTDGGLDSKSLAPGESYSATFTKVGTFKYHCTFHSSMTGTVTVTE